jgi:acyl-homoserine-lactone acylase
MTAWADGLNFYLATHPAVRPRVLTRFEPWMPLAFSEGSIGGDIEDIGLRGLEAFYGDSAALPPVAAAEGPEPEPSGSNGIALGPSVTASGRAMLLINPHTSFYFRAEGQLTSDEGLNAYGAATWGQFFIYQGFNDRAGWMHTSSGADVVDEWAITVARDGDRVTYRHGDSTRVMRRDTIQLRVAGGAPRTFTVWRAHQGPIVRTEGGRWIAARIMWTPVTALTQSWERTKARSLADFRRTMELHTNSTNNTLYADADGHFGYFHANFVPRRDPRRDWRKPVDGNDPATDWQGVHTVDESPNAIDPPTGWAMNTNNWPYTAAGPASPRQADYPPYMDAYTENPRGTHALTVLTGRRGITLDTLIAMAYDPWLPGFTDLMPALTAAWDALPAGAAERARLGPAIAALRGWDLRWAEASVPTTLAVFYGDELWRRVRADAESEEMSVYEYMARRTTPALRLSTLAATVDTLTARFGRWDVPWGEVNRLQRVSAAIEHPFSDAAPSVPIGFTSSRWGSLASFGARTFPGTRKLYGTSGNSFVAVVEFGPRVEARAVMVGGQRGDTTSRHFADQVERYRTGALRPVYFHPDQLEGHVERRYRPGESP